MAKKQAFVQQVQGTTLVGRADSAHWVVMDGSPTFGGSNAGSSPKELLLVALGGCTAMDVIPILRKKHAPVDRVEVRVEGNVREEHPQVFTDIHIHYTILGDGVKTSDVEHAIELSTTKYCALSAMLQNGAVITHSYSIEPSQCAARREPVVTSN